MKTKVLKIGYFGKQGSNTEEAAKKFFLSEKKNNSEETKAISNSDEAKEYGSTCDSYEFLPFTKTSELIKVLADKQVEKAVLPIENSTEGIVTSSIDNLIAENINGFGIEGETIMQINHNLIGVGFVNQIEKIISHPQALAQCEMFIKKTCAEAGEAESTSSAVKQIAEENDPKFAAVGSRQAFEIYRLQNPNLKILAENIQDSIDNETRFIILGSRHWQPQQNDKTSIVFGLPHRPGALQRVLEVLDVLDINMTMIVSRPSKRKLGEYNFWVDFEGHKQDEHVKIAFKQIANPKRTTFLRVLGSYPKAE